MKRYAIAAVVIVVAAGLAYAGYGLHQKRVLREQVARAVDAASGQLNVLLGADIVSPTAAIIEQLDRGTEATDTDLQNLRAASARPDRSLVEAADAYLSNVLAVLKRQDGSARGRLKFTDSRKALAEHMALVGQRGDGWIATAIRLKDRLDADYFECRIATTSLGHALGDLPGARRAIAALLPSARLVEEGAVSEARERALAAAQATLQEYEQAKRLVPR